METDEDGSQRVIFSHAIATNKDHKMSPLADTLSRARQIAKHLDLIKTTYKPDYIALENLSYGSVGNATRNLAILFGLICSELGIRDPNVISPTSLKKYATGSGKASKKEMLEAVDNPQFKKHISSMTQKAGKYDLADAYWIAKWIENENR